jgi:hypothetical protein
MQIKKKKEKRKKKKENLFRNTGNRLRKNSKNLES